ncbi:serine/threonine-protein kinase [Kribbella jiaozuonensis]|uniref:non-specific serine/threonine protein kinase n=1 Tax=Kribbella jiaozuonensis TaxID=2575441 RepID=A0A4U3LL58_9ACTN|nr:serine/threonine-protein kinase [Kribbella jiaozuonensis]TKK76320.1 serine/threonine protein kinase [Kribbella jiaozuonensis]
MFVAKRYRLGSSLGRGGMGEVFRGTDEQLRREVAVKLLLRSDRDPRAAERFHREARAAARLNDAHVVAVYDFGQHDDGFFLVMELVEGGSVADELEEHGPLPKDRAIEIIEQSAAGLAAAHREDVVHRDVKPSNLLISTDGTIKVADFGIAHLPGEGASTLTGTGQIIGSAQYLAPERAQGGQAGKPADVYALGCVLYQLVTGRPPFTGEHPTSILYQHVDADPAPPSLERPELAGAFEAVLLQMLAKDPADRPTAAEIEAGALSASTPVAATAPIPATAAVPLAVTEPVNTRPATTQAQRDRRMTWIAAGIALLATAGAVLAVVLLNNNGTTPPPTTDVGPQPGATSSTPTSQPTTSSSTTAPSQSASSQPTKSAPTPSTSLSPTPTPSATPTTTPSTSPTPSQSPPSSTPTPSAPSRSTPSTSSSPTPSNTPSSAPPSNTPSPSAAGL